MPLFEYQFPARTAEADGKPITISPSAHLQYFGPALEVVISPTPQHLEALASQDAPAPTPFQGLALIDTGASITTVDETICKTLGLKPTGYQKVAHAGGFSERPCFAVQIMFPNTPFPAPLFHPRVASVDLQYGNPRYALLLGRDLLARLKLVYNGVAGRFELAI